MHPHPGPGALLALALVVSLAFFWAQAAALRRQRVCAAPVAIDGFLSDAECRAVIEAALARGLTRSEVAAPEGDEISSIRTSEQVFLEHSHPAVAPVVAKAERLLGMPRKYFESVQVVRYTVGQRYEAHYDSDADTPSADLRSDTLLVYLNSVRAGGETVFPEVGLSVSPSPGKAIRWKNVDGEGRVLPCAFHGGLPVRRGVKWICTVWCKLRASP
jgi:prolyl 4-hydroxylase